jgi:hypothetical protein
MIRRMLVVRWASRVGATHEELGRDYSAGWKDFVARKADVLCEALLELLAANAATGEHLGEVVERDAEILDRRLFHRRLFERDGTLELRLALDRGHGHRWLLFGVMVYGPYPH